MIKDVCQFLLLLTFVLAAFSSALTQLDLVGDPELASSYYPIEGGEVRMRNVSVDVPSRGTPTGAWIP
jgi:hypothetical protein